MPKIQFKSICAKCNEKQFGVLSENKLCAACVNEEKGSWNAGSRHRQNFRNLLKLDTKLLPRGNC